MSFYSALRAPEKPIFCAPPPVMRALQGVAHLSLTLQVLIGIGMLARGQVITPIHPILGILALLSLLLPVAVPALKANRPLAAASGGLLLWPGGEMVVNFVLAFYRPRVAGEPRRVFYESRLLGVFCEPEGIIRSVAQTIDYQFGFRVSETWFYRLLGRIVLPLLLQFHCAMKLLRSRGGHKHPNQPTTSFPL